MDSLHAIKINAKPFWMKTSSSHRPSMSRPHFTSSRSSFSSSSSEESVLSHHQIIGVVLACLTLVGICIFFPILFACTLPDDATIKNTHEHTCTFYDLETTSSHRCCQRQDVSCSG